MAADLALKDLVWLYLWPPWPLCSSTHQTGVMTLSSFGFNVNTVQHLREIWVDADHNCCFTQCCMLTLLMDAGMAVTVLELLQVQLSKPFARKRHLATSRSSCAWMRRHFRTCFFTSRF